MSNSKSEYNTHNRFGNAAKPGDEKPAFFRAFADWLEQWRGMQIKGCGKFTLTAQTFDGLIVTLRATAALLDDLFDEGYKYVMLARLQTDPLERQFGKYRQMSGGRFLVSLREVQDSEKILRIKSLLKADIHSWDERVKCDPFAGFEDLLQELRMKENEFQENSLCDDSRDVAIHISGYITKQMLEKSKCPECQPLLRQNKISSDYLDILNRGGLIKPSESLVEYVCAGFAILDTAHELLLRYSNVIRNASLLTLETFQKQDVVFVCQLHDEWGRKKANSIIANIFLNNEQKIKTTEIRKDEVSAFKTRHVKQRKESI